MKLAKLSLAAIVAAGAMTTIASAQPLEEAIKGVEFSGMIEYTLNDSSRDEANAVNEETTSDWDFLGKLTAPVADNLKATTVFASSNAGGDDVDADLKDDGARGGMNFDIRKAFFTYNKDAVTVIAGLQDLKTPVTDNGFNGSKGEGVVALYNMDQVTAAAAYFGNTSGVLGGENDIAAMALIGSMDAFSARAWYVTSPEVIDDHYFLEGSVAMAGASLTAQYISTKLDAVDAETGKFYAIKAGYKYENFGISGTYTKNDEDQPVHGLDPDMDTDVIASGWRVGYDAGDADIEKSWGIRGDAAFGEYGVHAGYAKFEGFEAADNEVKEMYAGVSYKYSKNFSTYVRYSDVNYDSAGDDFQYLRFNAKYSF